MDNQKLREQIALLERKVEDMDRRTLNGTEVELRDEMVAEIRKMRKELPQGPRTLKSMTHSDGPFRSLGDQLGAVMRAGTPGGKIDQRLYEIRAVASGESETVPADGGF